MSRAGSGICRILESLRVAITLPHMVRSAIILSLLLVRLTGCAAPPEFAPDPLGAVPMDFTLDVTILTGEDIKDRPEAQWRQSRYVLFSDGSLHYGADNERKADWMPDLARRLSRQRVAEIWSLSQQLGFADPVNGDVPTNFMSISPAPTEVVYLIAYTGSNKRWEFVRRTEPGDNADPASVTLVRRLAMLAWANDRSSREMPLLPNRYDFGPDPYARYRRP